MQPDKHNDLDKRLSRLYAAPVPESFGTAWRADIRREESIQTMKNASKWNRVFRKFAPVMCALVLVMGSLWAGTLDMNEASAPQGENGQVMMTSRSASGTTYKNAVSYDMAASVEESYDTGMGMSSSVTTYGAQAQEGRKLVRTADLSIRTDVYDDALSQVQTLLDDMGGYIESLYQYGENARRVSLTLRVPAEKLDAFMGGIEGLGKVTSRSESTTDMTVQYADNQARLETLYQKRDRLNDMLIKAENVSDLIEIETAIADTQYQIDLFETSQRTIDRQVDMSMVTLTLMEQEKTVVNPELTLGQRISAGFSAGVEWLGEFGRNLIVFVVMIAPAAAAAAVVWLGWKWIRRLRGSKNKEE